jgi:cytochrome c55X
VSYCVRCHGLNLAVGSSAFFDLRTFPKDDKARFVESVNNGKRAMPAWKGIVKPDEIEAIWAYIGSVNGW